MTTAVQRSKTARRRHAVRRGFTLIELTVSMALLIILLGALTSVMVLAGQALPDAGDPTHRKMAALDIVDRMAAELFYAISITEASQNTVTFTVADRGHGAAGPETIRYAWSGTPGDPLTWQYNGGPVVTLCEDVQLLRLSYDTRVERLDALPAVLFLVVDPWNITAQEAARQTMIENWGFQVEVFPEYGSAAEFRAAAANCDVIYVSSEVDINISSHIKDLGRGIVCEDGAVRVDIGMGNQHVWFAETTINILNNTHDITSVFPAGPLTIVDSQQSLLALRNGLAAGAELLAEDLFYGYDALVAIELGGGLHNGGAAAARRVAPPWGDSTFDFRALNANGSTLMKRSIVWAAAPVVHTGVGIALRPSTALERIRTEVPLLNTPRVGP